MSRFAALLVVASLGCSSPEPQRMDWTFDYRGSDEGLAAAQAAAREWNACSGVTLQVQRGHGHGVPLVQVASIVEAPQCRGSTDTDNDDAVVGVRFVLYENATATLAHEFGHVLGLGHEPGGIMAAEDPGFVPSVTDRDCAKLVR